MAKALRMKGHMEQRETDVRAGSFGPEIAT